MFSRDRSKHPCQRHYFTLHGVVFDILDFVGKGAPWRRAHHAPASEMVGTLSPSVFALRAVALRTAAEALPTRSYLIVIPCVLNLM
jgi:hypothetical protein